jgi:hypothetical protein
MKTIIIYQTECNDNGEPSLDVPQTVKLDAFNYSRAVIICPKCETRQGIEYDDYVIRPMLWCQSCGFYGIFSDRITLRAADVRPYGTNLVSERDVERPYGTNLVSERDVERSNETPKLDDFDMNDKFNTDIFWDKPLHFYDADMLYFTKICNCQIARLDPAMKYTQEQICTLIEEGTCDDMDDRDGDETEMSILNGDLCYLDVGSFNLTDPAKDYPREFDFAHDGIYIHYCYLDEFGEEKESYFWGC